MERPKPTPDNFVRMPSQRDNLLDAQRRYIPDPTPVAPPVGYVRQPSLAEQIRTMVRSERLRLEVEAAGAETFEEADDFEVGDDYDPDSPYEMAFDPRPDTHGEPAAPPPAPSTTSPEPTEGAEPGGSPASPPGPPPAAPAPAKPGPARAKPA